MILDSDIEKMYKLVYDSPLFCGIKRTYRDCHNVVLIFDRMMPVVREFIQRNYLGAVM